MRTPLVRGEVPENPPVPRTPPPVRGEVHEKLPVRGEAP